MPWELLIALILAIGIYLTIKESREKRHARGKQVRATMAEQHPDETVVKDKCVKK